MTNEQIDQARVDEAFRVIKENARKNLSLEVARLAREAQEAEIKRLREALTDAYDCFRVYGEHMPEYMHGEPFKKHLNRYRAALQLKEGEG